MVDGTLETGAESLTALRLRLWLAERDLPMHKFAKVAGLASTHHLSEVAHGKRPLTPGLRARLWLTMRYIELTERAG